MAETSLSMSVNNSLKKTVVAVMIEMLQNISYHGADQTENANDKPGLIMLCEEADAYYMITGNYIKNEKVEKFEDHVAQINTLNSDGLNQLYNEVILRENKVGDKGAGLGLIDLRFKTQNKIETKILKRNESRSFLIVKARINF